MKPKFFVGFEGVRDLFQVRHYRADKGEKTPHEATEYNPYFNPCGGRIWLFSDGEIAVAFAQTINQKIKNTVKKFQKLNKQENPK